MSGPVQDYDEQVWDERVSLENSCVNVEIIYSLCRLIYIIPLSINVNAIQLYNCDTKK